MKKGFTLIEVLGVLTILGVIVFIAVPSITSNIDRQKEQQRKLIIDNAIHATKTYVETNNGVEQCYALTFLKEQGYIKEIKDPLTGNDMTGNVCVTLKDGVYKYNYTDVVFEGESSLDTGLSIGQELYIDPQTGKTCNTYVEDNSLGNVKTGCLKWYVFNNTNSATYDLILDHNAKAFAGWNADCYSQVYNILTEELNSLVTDSGWKLTPRAPSATEIAHLTGADRTDTIKWDTTKKEGMNDIETQVSWYYFDGLKNANNNSYTGWHTQYANATQKSEFAWLYDNLWSCVKYGCNVEDNNKYPYGTNSEQYMNEYWTTDSIKSDVYLSEYCYNAWTVECNGSLSTTRDNSKSGLRPIISFPKKTT